MGPTPATSHPGELKKTRSPEVPSGQKRRRHVSPPANSPDSCAGGGSLEDQFARLPDDLLVCIFARLSASASSTSDLFYVVLSCKRFSGLCVFPLVLSKASAKCLAVRAKKWSESAHQFLRRCALAGNLDACYMLGMIRFYCLGSRAGGISLMAKAAIGYHAPALYSLAVIQFNGSGGSKADKDLRAGVALCARAAGLGHVDALRELGHCLQDGYGVRQNLLDGRRYLIQANYKEMAAALTASGPAESTPGVRFFASGAVAAMEPHPANRFLVEWFAEKSRAATAAEDLRLCSNRGCGRPETRRHEFRRCSVCGAVNYCSRSCQAVDWKIVHKMECITVERWLLGGDPPADPLAQMALPPVIPRPGGAGYGAHEVTEP
ncbi:F-box protein [Apostasia shenzhenica]|uniref:F-box protein n=1 Tax=Apostasia shenzhenica TaxID=1088818 RepID=A0A2H9ZVZ3_9ASPA|nr:F-box protein [Apostasia shenzhenica]